MQSPLRLLKKYLYSDMNISILSSQKLELLVLSCYILLLFFRLTSALLNNNCDSILAVLS